MTEQAPNRMATRVLRGSLVALLVVIGLAACTLLEATPTPIAAPAPQPPVIAPQPGVSGAVRPLGVQPGALARYDFTVTLDLVGDAAQVVQFIDVTNPGPDTWTEVVFQVPAHLIENEQFVLSGVSIFDGLETQAVRYLVSDGFIRVFLPQPVPTNSGVGVSLVYGLSAINTVVFSQMTRRPVGNVGVSPDGVLQFINWYPVLVPYRRGAGWLLWQSTSVGDPVVTETADYRLTVIAPDEEAVVISGGPTSREGRNWRFEVRGSRGVMFVVSKVGFTVSSAVVDGVTILSYYLPASELPGVAALEVAGKALQLYNATFGTYPYNTLVVVQGAYLHSVAMGGMLVNTLKGYEDYDGQPTSLLVTLTAQGLSQHWWGGVVGTNAVLEPWLAGSLQLYSEYLYFQTYHPEWEAWFWEARVDYWSPAGTLERTAYDFATTSALLRDIQRQGLRFLVDLRDQVGSTVFDATLRDYYFSGAFNLTDSDDFFAALARNNSAPIAGVVAQYFEVRAVPTIALTERRDVTPTPPLVYVVQPGDTLLGIALQFGVDVEDLRRINGLGNDEPLSLGQRLTLP